MEARNTSALFNDVVQRATLDPDWFCADVLQCPNDPWQSEMMNAIADLDRQRLNVEPIFNPDGLNRFTTRAFHGPGKTHYLAKLMHWWNFTRKGRIVATAPKEKQLTTRLWPEFRKILGKAGKEYRSIVKVDKTAITWFNDVDWCALVETAANPENIAGYHDDWLLFLVEEASGVSEEMFPAIEGTLSTPNAVLAMIGNPTRTQGEFYNSHTKRGTKELYYRKAIQHHETPRVSQKWVQGMVDKYGKDSPVVQVRCFGNFVDTEENQLIAMQWLHDAIEREQTEDGSIPRLRLTVDVADGGLDSSVISAALHFQSFKLMLKQRVFNFPPAVAPIKTAKAAARMFDAFIADYPFASAGADIVVDSIGVGAGTCGWLIDNNYPTVRYMGGASSDIPKLWRNKRTQSYLCYRDDLRDGNIAFAEGYFEANEEDDFLAQHASIKTKPGTERIEELMTKEEMKRLGIKSPDMVDPLAMHYATSAPTIGKPSTEVTTIPSITEPGGW